MPSWILTLIIQVIVKFGFPALVAAIAKMPSVPAEIKVILQKLLDALQDPQSSNSSARKTAIAEIKACQGVACEIGLKK